MPFTNAELHMLKHLLKELETVQSNAGCNDLTLPATVENLEFMHAFNAVFEETPLNSDGKTIFGMDTEVTVYFLQRINQQLKLGLDRAIRCSVVDAGRGFVPIATRFDAPIRLSPTVLAMLEDPFLRRQPAS
jgi:hypothetical protein